MAEPLCCGSTADRIRPEVHESVRGLPVSRLVLNYSLANMMLIGLFFIFFLYTMCLMYHSYSCYAKNKGAITPLYS
jgi:hypothetical protein